MDANIHYVIEEQFEEHRWVGIFASDCALLQADPSSYELWNFMEQDYNFFAALTDLYRKGYPLPNIPIDASEMTLAYTTRQNDNYCSHGHCSLYEFAKLKIQSNDQLLIPAILEKLNGEDPVLTSLGLSSHQKDFVDRFRVCFWFGI